MFVTLFPTVHSSPSLSQVPAHQCDGWWADRCDIKKMIVVYSDASEYEIHLGAAVVALNDDLQVVESNQIQMGQTGLWSVHAAELIGIFLRD